MRPTSFLVNGRIAIDAGALTDTLTIEEQSLLTHVFLSHSHMDHLCTLPFLIDNVLPVLRETIRLYGPADTVRCLKEHLFNDHLWPDFTRISNGNTTALDIETLYPGQSIRAHGVEITAFRMEHAISCHGHLLQEADCSVIVCADTASTGSLAEELPKANGLKAVILECSFPRSLAAIASASRHLSTDAFARESRRIPSGLPILVTHLKPGWSQAVRKELAELGLENVSFLEQGKEYMF